MAKLINEDQNDWDLKINTVLMGYRASFQSSTGYSPYYLLFQKEMRLPIDSEISPPIHTSGKNCDELVSELLVYRESVFKKATEKIKDSQIQQKETYDRKHVTEELSVGTSVLLENSAQKGRKGGKLQELFRGNYTISENLGKGLYRLKNDDGKILKNKINIKRLKVCRKRGEIDCSRNETDTKKACTTIPRKL